MHLELEAQRLAPSIRTKVLDFPIKLIFDLILKFLELFKGFKLMLRETDIPISTQVIIKGHKVTITIARRDTHWSTHIGMYDFQQVDRPFNKTGERCPSHFAHEARLACVKGIKIQ
jgi:hypothetical protein